MKVKTSAPGTVTRHRRGLEEDDKVIAAGVHTLKVTVSKKARAKHQKTKVTVSLKVGTKTVSTSKKLRL